MAKRKKADTMAPMMPTPAQRRKWAAESMATTVMETSPTHRKMKDAITDAVMGAADKAVRRGMRGPAKKA